MNPQEGGGLTIAREVLEQLPTEAKHRCLLALKYAETGQLKLRQGDPQGALPNLLSAHRIFESLTQARALLGINKADIAAAYGNIGHYREAVPYAEDAVSIVSGYPRLAFTEAMARMSLANGYCVLGNIEQGEVEYDAAHRLLQAMPGAEMYLSTLEHNRQQVLSLGARGAGSMSGNGGCLLAVLLSVGSAVVVLI